MSTKLTPHDEREIELFKQYMRTTSEWNEKNDGPFCFGDEYDLETAQFNKRRVKAHYEIYKNIYGENP